MRRKWMMGMVAVVFCMAGLAHGAMDVTPGGGTPSTSDVIASNDVTYDMGRAWGYTAATGSSRRTVGQTFRVADGEDKFVTTVWFKASYAPTGDAKGRAFFLIVEEYDDASDTSPGIRIARIGGTTPTGTVSSGWWCFDIGDYEVRLEGGKQYGVRVDWIAGPKTGQSITWQENGDNEYADGKEILGQASGDGSTYPEWGNQGNKDLLFYVHGYSDPDVDVDVTVNMTPSTTNAIAYNDTTGNMGRAWGYTGSTGSYRRTVGQTFYVSGASDKNLTTFCLKASSQPNSAVEDRPFKVWIEEYSSATDYTPDNVVEAATGTMPSSGMASGWWEFDLSSLGVVLEAGKYYGLRVEWVNGPLANQSITWWEVSGDNYASGNRILGQESSGDFPVFSSPSTYDLLFYVHGTNVSAPSDTVYIDPDNTASERDGSIENPYNTWAEMVTDYGWVNSTTYLQKRGTVAEEMLDISGKSDVVIGVYGSGNAPAEIDAEDTRANCIKATTCARIIITGFKCYGATDAAIRAMGSEDFLIQGNECHDSFYGIAIGTSGGGLDPDGVVDNNYIHDTDGDSIGAWTLSPGITATNNVCTRFGNDGIDVLGSTGATISGNICFDSVLGPRDSNTGIKAGGNAGAGGSNNTVTNNIVWNCKNIGIYNRHANGNTYTGNYAYGCGVNFNLVNGTDGGGSDTDVTLTYNRAGPSYTGSYSVYLPPPADIVEADNNVWDGGDVRIHCGLLYTNLATYQSYMSDPPNYDHEQNTTFGD
jgi:parallel beta-helix repeat protein